MRYVLWEKSTKERACMVLRKTFIQLCAVCIAILFFMPWVNVTIDMVKSVGIISKKIDEITKTEFMSKISEKFSDVTHGAVKDKNKVSLSGFDIAKSGGSRASDTISKLLTFVEQKEKDPKQIQYLFAVPFIAVFLAWVMTGALGSIAFFRFLSAITSMVIAVISAVKLAGASFSSEFAQVQFTYGVWITCALFFVMGLLGVVGVKIKESR
jgi:hypothetical protein